MKKIAYIVPYFGKFPKNFQYWLLSCSCNPTIDWLIFTDDHTKYNYPSNVKVTYCSFDDMKKRIQNLYDFPVCLERPYKLCDFRPAYGEIFEQELKKYDFWGHCDLDLVWGDIRKFITDDILDKFDKIGNQGHSTLYKNNVEVNTRYHKIIKDEYNEVGYKEVFSIDKSFCFDEVAMERLYNKLNIEYYKEVNFAHLKKYDYGFFLDLLPSTEDYKNKYQVFTWKRGQLIRHYLDKNNDIKTEEYMYLHYWCRPTTFDIKEYDSDKQYLIYADKTTDKYYDITADLIRKKSKRNKIRYYAKSIWFNRRKLTLERILFNIKGMLAYKKG